MMKKLNSTVLLIIMSLVIPVTANADGWFSSGRSGVAPVTNKLYEDECSGCHFAYQPGLLPARSWEKLMANLDDHFGENAELTNEDTKILTQYAVDNAADTSKHKRSVKINRSIGKNQTPLRITKVRYIIRKHDELSKRHIENNPKVKSLSRCQVCHTKIATGSFSEREINIPGFGRWED